MTGVSKQSERPPNNILEIIENAEHITKLEADLAASKRYIKECEETLFASRAANAGEFKRGQEVMRDATIKTVLEWRGCDQIADAIRNLTIGE